MYRDPVIHGLFILLQSFYHQQGSWQVRLGFLLQSQDSIQFARIQFLISHSRDFCGRYMMRQRGSPTKPVKFVVAYGGTPINQQLRELERGFDILIGSTLLMW